ncbi:MAG: MmgE/PrpD family protein [Syntrophales bacterium]|nr:MmgE/PrpD family protein [Syntrophales bacterium]
MSGNGAGFTAKLASFIVNTKEQNIPEWAYEHAKVAFMDWLAVTIAGKDDPLVKILIDYTEMMGGKKQATIIGYNMKKDVSSATLINGSASHTLDYDDTLVSFLGHPSVTIFPSLLALSEWRGKSGKDFLTAYIIGLQVGGTIGACASLDHYMGGWHATSTLGHLASAAACSRLLGLSEKQTTYALGIGGTQSSGLKRVFGTMCKPFHAGRSSQAGLLAALLAEKGFTSAEDILEGPQGFFEALKGKVNDDIVNMLGMGWDVQNLNQKYHASCHATHSPLEAALSIIKGENINLDAIKNITIHASTLSLQAAGKTEPATGLEGKFSIPYCVANALLREETGMQAFTDEKVNDPAVRTIMRKINIINDPKIQALESIVEVETSDGKSFNAFSDILQQIPSLEIKKERVASKFFDLSEPVWGKKRCLTLKKKIEAMDKLKNMKNMARALL